MKSMLKRDLLKQLIPVAIIATVAAVLLVTPSFAAKGRHADPPCTITLNGVAVGQVAVGQVYTVSESGLPTGTAINLWVTDPSGNTTGSPLGSTPTGSFDLNESSASAGTWTYTFSGPTKNNSSTTTVYGSCSVDAY
jgi:hypothetical protein